MNLKSKMRRKLINLINVVLLGAILYIQIKAIFYIICRPIFKFENKLNDPGKGFSQRISVTRRLPDIGFLEPGQLIFSEEFYKLNFTLWEPVLTMSGCGRGEFQIYNNSKKNVFVKDGLLHIQPTLTEEEFGSDFLYNGNLVMESCTDPLHNGCNKTAGAGNILNPVIYGRLRTLKSFSFLYGKVEARAKVPVGDWIWPAIWMNPTNKKYGESWPMSGEIDIMESRGNRQLYRKKVNVGVHQVSSTLHFGPNKTEDRWKKVSGKKRLATGFHEDFHRFQLVWTPENISFGVDDKITNVIQPPSNGGMHKFGDFKGENIWENATNPVMAPFDDFFYFIVNVAVGGQTGYFNARSVNFPYKMPWNKKDKYEIAMAKFWRAKNKWYPTWRGKADGKTSSAFKIDYIRVWAI